MQKLKDELTSYDNMELRDRLKWAFKPSYKKLICSYKRDHVTHQFNTTCKRIIKIDDMQMIYYSFTFCPHCGHLIILEM